MKAILSKTPGPPATLVLEEIPIPQPQPGQVLIRVSAVSLNFPDVLIIEDKYQLRPPRPFSPGAELAGVVEAVGEGVTRVAVGDRVMANPGYGALREYALSDETKVLKIPETMPYEEAAAFLVTYATAYLALSRRANLQPGQTLLVLGAAGGVGLAACELGKAMGLHVVAACSSQEKADLAIQHGAAEGLVYATGAMDREAQKALGEQFKQAGGPAGFDAILDVIGDAYAEPALRSIAWDGSYLVVGFAAGEIPRIPLNLALLKSCNIRGVFWGGWQANRPDEVPALIAELMALYEAGKIRPHISATYPLERAGEGIERLAGRSAVGKVVVTVT